ncbi:hypothetical protein ACFVGN_39355 [Streptomyces sp. NPDC057757]|uniref:hypothetical protein n=1 Tax=Streptomyces sp. NPDC057757 TaxID=3346241 RepID=UPI00367B3622
MVIIYVRDLRTVMAEQVQIQLSALVPQVLLSAGTPLQPGLQDCGYDSASERDCGTQ